MTSVKPSDRTASLVFKLFLYGALTVACMYLIYRLSAQSGTESSALSTKVAKVLAGILYVGFDSFGEADKLEILRNISLPVRKAAHMTEYAVLGGLASATMWQLVQLVSKDRASVSFSSIAGFVIAAGYACTDELHQVGVAGRAGEFTDVLIDSCGAFIGIVIVACVLYLGAMGWRRANKQH